MGTYDVFYGIVLDRPDLSNRPDHPRVVSIKKNHDVLQSSQSSKSNFLSLSDRECPVLFALFRSPAVVRVVFPVAWTQLEKTGTTLYSEDHMETRLKAIKTTKITF